MQHVGAVGSAAVSQLKGPVFDLGSGYYLCQVSHVFLHPFGFLKVLWFSFPKNTSVVWHYMVSNISGIRGSKLTVNLGNIGQLIFD